MQPSAPSFNATTGAPNSAGAQFFLVYGDSTLPPDYSVIGELDEDGLALVDEVARGGQDGSNDTGDGHPLTPLTLRFDRFATS